MKKILVVIDMVKGFVTEGAMHDEGIGRIIPKQIELINNALENNDGVIFFKDCHAENAVEFKSFPPHCIKGTSEAELVNELMGYEGKALAVFEKNSTAGIFAKGFFDCINEIADLEEVEVVGCCTDICVLNFAIPLKNYFNQEDKEITVSVVKDAVETYDAPNHSREEYNDIAIRLMAQAGVIIK